MDINEKIVKLILNPKPRYYDIDNAPFQIGDKVKVVSVDGSLADSYIGLVGYIVYYEYDCGCGQTYPEDPMIGVQLLNNHIQEFWKEELQTKSPIVKT